jgi:uncharacterized DUF497 family protein
MLRGDAVSEDETSIFEWDSFNIRHIAEHGVTPEEAEQVLRNDPIDGGVQEHEGEERYVELGITDAVRILVVITTMRGTKIRVCTAYPASPGDRTFYLREKGRQYGRE